MGRLTMFDLEAHVRQWRRELEATLAFSPAELDELEDHLRSSCESRLKLGDPVEAAWTHARAALGPASALALEFAKDKLMPALGRLLLAWWQPLLLLVFFIVTFQFTSDVYVPFVPPDASAPSGPNPLVQTPQPAPPFHWANTFFWFLSFAAILLTLILLRTRAQRVGLLAGIGNAIALLPLFHLALYNSAAEQLIGPGWSATSGSTGVLPVTMGIIGLLVINIWARRRTERDERPAVLGTAGTLVFLLALAPTCNDLIGNLSLRELYQLPAPAGIAYHGDALIQFNNWWFVGTLFKSVILIATLLPLVLIVAGCLLAAALGSSPRAIEPPPVEPAAFPASRDLPWLLALAATGVAWLVSSFVEPPFASTLQRMQTSILHRGETRGGLEIMVLCSMIPFFFCAAEFTRRLCRARRARPFYATLVIVIELGVVALLIPLPTIWQWGAIHPAHPNVTAQPEWLNLLAFLALIVLAVVQGRFIRARSRSGDTEISLWKFTGASLVGFGLTIGAALACAAAALVDTAFVMARISVIYIRALLEWSAAARANPPQPFHPGDYIGTSQLFEWAISGPGTLFLFLALGLAIAIILSALEFIRFNALRLHRLRQARVSEATVVATNG